MSSAAGTHGDPGAAVVINGDNQQQLGDEDATVRPHQLAIHSYKSPTFCHFCGEMLFGMFKQVRVLRAKWDSAKIFQFFSPNST